MRENDLLQHVYAGNADLPHAVSIPPGDDMGAVHLPGDEVLVSVDQLADGVHLHLSNTPLALVARKAIARGVSDIAAMAAEPVAAMVAAMLPRDFTEEQANELCDHLRHVAAGFHCPLVGGDVGVWDQPLLLSVSVLARPAEGIPPIRRNTAQPGDRLVVTGSLGGSLEAVGDQPPHHLTFEPRLSLARSLARSLPVHAMMDLSDGLGTDLPRLCAASGLAGELWLNHLPISPAARQAADRSNQPAWRHAVGDGEDYELLLAVGPNANLPPSVEGVPLSEVGRVMPGHAGQVTLYHPDGHTEPLANLGWQHRGHRAT